MVITKTYQDIKPVLMDSSGSKVKEPYYIIDADNQSIFVISPGTNSSEYNKTEGFVSHFEGVHSFICLYGQGVILIQRNDETGDAKEFKVVTLNPGKQAIVPAGWATCFINIGKNLLVILGNLDVKSKYLDSKPILKRHGLAYYVIEKKGEVSFEQNPNYSIHPQIATE